MRADGNLFRIIEPGTGIELDALPHRSLGIGQDHVEGQRCCHTGLAAAGAADHGRDRHFVGIGRDSDVLLRVDHGIPGDAGQRAVPQRIDAHCGTDTDFLAAADTARDHHQDAVIGCADAHIPFGLDLRRFPDRGFGLVHRQVYAEHAADAGAFGADTGTHCDIGDHLRGIRRDLDAAVRALRLDDRTAADRGVGLVEIDDVGIGDADTGLLGTCDGTGKGDGLGIGSGGHFDAERFGMRSGLAAGGGDMDILAEVGLGGVHEQVDREGAGHRRVALRGGARHGFGVVVVRAEIIQRIQRIEVEVLDPGLHAADGLRNHIQRRDEIDLVLGRRHRQ